MAAAARFDPPPRFSFRAADWEDWRNEFLRFWRASKLHKEDGYVQRDALLYAMGTKQAVQIMKTCKWGVNEDGGSVQLLSSPMAARQLVAPYSRCVRAYLPNLQAVVQHFRNFSSQDKNSDTTNSYVIDEPDITQVVWPDPALGPLCTSDRRFPLPGHVGVIHDTESSASLSAEAARSFSDPVITLPAQPGDRHFGVLVHYLTHNSQLDMKEFIPEEGTPKASDLLECAAHDCPQILRKDFQDLFPDRNTMEGPFTIITLSQHTENDMTVWSMEVESEREALLETFMHGAMEICDSLTKKGFWADFIDPSTGKPFRGPHTNAAFFETDERYCKLGFQIEDLGCCKVIRHLTWGTHAFVSCLFTNAPVDHPIISSIVQSECVSD